MIKEYILCQLKIHCKVYKLDYDELYKKFLDNEKTPILLNEFNEIYNLDSLNLYSDFLNNTFNTVNTLIKNTRRDEKEINLIIFLLKEFEPFNFFSQFISFSFLNGLLYEKFTYNRKIETNNIEIIDLINYVYNDLTFFIDFLYVNNTTDKNKKNFNEKSIKKFLFRVVIVLRNENVLQFKKTTIVKKNNINGRSLRYANIIEFKDF